MSSLPKFLDCLPKLWKFNFHSQYRALKIALSLSKNHELLSKNLGGSRVDKNALDDPRPDE